MQISARIFKVYVEALMGFDHAHCPEGPSATLLPGCVPENGSRCGNNMHSINSKDRAGEGSLRLPQSSFQVTS